MIIADGGEYLQIGDDTTLSMRAAAIRIGRENISG